MGGKDDGVPPQAIGDGGWGGCVVHSRRSIELMVRKDRRVPVEAVVALVRAAMVIAAGGGEEYVRSSISPSGPGVARLDPGVPERDLVGRGKIRYVA